MIFLADCNRAIQLSGKRSIPGIPRTHTNSACCFTGYGDSNMLAFVFKTASLVLVTVFDNFLVDFGIKRVYLLKYFIYVQDLHGSVLDK